MWSRTKIKAKELWSREENSFLCFNIRLLCPLRLMVFLLHLPFVPHAFLCEDLWTPLRRAGTKGVLECFWMFSMDLFFLLPLTLEMSGWPLDSRSSLTFFPFPLSFVFTRCSVETSCMQTAPPCSPLECWCLWGGGVAMNNSSRCSAVPVGRFQIIFYFKQAIQCYVSYNILSLALQWLLFFLFITVNVKF